MTSIDQMVLATVKCTICGAGYGKCDCWERCSCGWSTERGTPCENTETTRCSTKIKYAKQKKGKRKS